MFWFSFTSVYFIYLFFWKEICNLHFIASKETSKQSGIFFLFLFFFLWKKKWKFFITKNEKRRKWIDASPFFSFFLGELKFFSFRFGELVYKLEQFFGDSNGFGIWGEKEWKMFSCRLAHIDAKDIEKVSKMVDEKQKWLDEKMNAQSKRALHLEPVVTITQIKKEKEVKVEGECGKVITSPSPPQFLSGFFLMLVFLQAMEHLINPILNKPKPKPKPQEPPKEEPKAPEQDAGTGDAAAPPTMEETDVPMDWFRDASVMQRNDPLNGPRILNS